MQSLCLRAGALLRKQLGGAHRVAYKGRINLVTEMDRVVESLLVSAIRRNFPDHEILSEEMDEDSRPAGWNRPAAGGRPRWIIDPLDGTTNYAHGFPHFAVSIGLERLGRVVMGAVCNPMLGELYFAREGQGAWCNQRRLRVSQTRRLDRALLATGFPYDVRTSPENNFACFKAMVLAGQAVRRAGAAALDLCDVAAGRFDGFWEIKLKPWDVAAGALLIQEAGGRITDFSGRHFDLYGGSFLASNGRLHPALVKVLERARRPQARRPH